MDWRKIDNDREKYAAYLCSREWGVLKEAIRERSGGRCERCEVFPMHACHHLTYERKYQERLEDLQAICDLCHKFTHGKDSFDPKACYYILAMMAGALRDNRRFTPIDLLIGSVSALYFDHDLRATITAVNLLEGNDILGSSR